jgi:hypothetical protein
MTIYAYAGCHYAECQKLVHNAECHYAEYCCAECCYAECCYAECRYAECRGALFCCCGRFEKSLFSFIFFQPNLSRQFHEAFLFPKMLQNTGACIIKLITAIIYVFRNKLEF